MLLNNGNTIIKKFEKEPFPETITVVRSTTNGPLEKLNITDSNIKHNSDFIVNLFDSNPKDDHQKRLLKKM